MNLFSLEGKNAWVTGGCYGIGFAIAKAFAQAGELKRTEDELIKKLDKVKAQEAKKESKKQYVVTEEDIAEAVSVWTKIPVAWLYDREGAAERYAH